MIKIKEINNTNADPSAGRRSALDYTLKTPEERTQLVRELIDEAHDFSNSYLEKMADYILQTETTKTARESGIISKNRLALIAQRETSFEKLQSSFEGEDDFYPLIKNDKNIIFKHKINLPDSPELSQLQESIQFWENQLTNATGRDAYIIKSTIISQCKDKYAIQELYPHQRRKPPALPTTDSPIDYDFTDPTVCEAFLLYHEDLSFLPPSHPIWAPLQDFNKYLTQIKENPIYATIIELKSKGSTNAEIRSAINNAHTEEYISTLYRRKIPKLIAEMALAEYEDWYYLEIARGTYKRCTKCGQIKLANSRYFSKNKTAKDGFYSHCKDCRRAHRLAQGGRCAPTVKEEKK